MMCAIRYYFGDKSHSKFNFDLNWNKLQIGKSFEKLKKVFSSLVWPWAEIPFGSWASPVWLVLRAAQSWPKSNWAGPQAQTVLPYLGSAAARHPSRVEQRVYAELPSPSQVVGPCATKAESVFLDQNGFDS
jgi:hypothetical protein